MSFPPSLTTRIVRGRFVTFPDGKPSPGDVRIILDSYMQGPDDNAFVAPFDEIFVLDSNGSFTAVLPATNDPQWSPSHYKIIIRTQIAIERNSSGELKPIYKTQRGRLEVPYDGTGELDLSDILNIGFPQPGQLYIVRSQLGVPGGVATLGNDGKITASQLPPGQGGSVSWDEIEDKPDTFPADPPSWTDVTDKPAIFPAEPPSWTDVTDKPTTFPSTPAWTDVTGKPSTFPPTAHSHSTGQVTGLDAALADRATEEELTAGLATKASTTHVHAFDDIVNKPATYPHDPIQWADIQGKPDPTDPDPVDWTDIQNKPTTFTPTAHSHSQSDVTGLSSALGAKADASTVTAALSNKADLVGGVIPTAQLPAIAVIDFLGEVSSTSAMLALVGQKGDWCIRTDLGQHWVLVANDSTQLDSWKAIPLPTIPVQTVNGQTGSVVLGKSDVGLGNVDNTTDANKPVSTAQQTALNLKAPLANPTFTGTVSGVTAAMVGLGNVNNTSDTNKPVSTAQQTALDLKASLASPALTGSPTAPTQTAGDNSTKIATTAYVATAVAAGGGGGSSGPATVTQVNVWNATGSTITKGQAVYAAGLDATTGYPTVALAAATGVLAAAFLGLAAADIPTASSGLVTTSGVVDTLNTSAITAGSPVYLGTTAGSYSASPATAANFRVLIGIVLASSSTVGKVLVRPSGQPNIGYGTANQLLGMNAGAGGQEYKTLAGTNNQITVANTVGGVTLSIATAAALPGAPTTTTATAGDNTTKIATTAFVTTAVAATVAGPASSTDAGIPVFSGTTGKLVKTSPLGISTVGDLTGIRRLVRTLATDPGVTGIEEWDLNYAVSTASSDLERIYVSTVLTCWRNEVGFLRGTPHAGYKDDALIRAVPRSDLAAENGGFIELQNSARTQVLYKRDWRTGSLWRGDGTSAAVKMADVLVLSAAASVPAGTPAGTVIVRTAT